MMDVVQFAASFPDIPWYAWAGLFLLIIFFLGDRVLWDYEVKFPMTPGVGRGEVELEHLKKKGTQIEVKL